MNIDKYVKQTKIDQMGLHVTLINDKTFLLDNNEVSRIPLLNEIEKLQSQNKQLLTGWLGGHYDDFGFYDTKEDAERGYRPSERLYEIIDDRFDGKKVKITIEEIE